MKKFIAIIVILTLCYSCKKSDQKKSPNSINGYSISIKSEHFKEVIRDFYAENFTSKEKGIIVVYCESIEYKTSYIMMSSYYEDLDVNPPSYYTILDEIPVIFYAGMENIIEFDSSYLSDVQRHISTFLIEYEEGEDGKITQMPPNHNPAVWKIEIEADSIINKEILN